MIINGTYIINETGLCFLSPQNRKLSTDIELFNEILVTLRLFTDLMINGDIKEVKLGRHKIIYFTMDTKTLAVVTAGKSITKQKFISIIKKIFNSSSKKYNEHMKQVISPPSIFQSFDKIIKKFGMDPILILFSSPINENE